MFTEPCVRLPSGCSDAELGDTVLSALEHSQPSVPHPHPTQWRVVLEPLLEAAGVGSWKALASGAVCVHVELEGGELTTIPHVNEGARGGFKPDEASKKSIAMPATADAIGAVCREAIALSR